MLGASLAWLVIAPAYASALVAVARLAAPALERTPGTRYAAEGSRVLAYRPLWLPSEGRSRELVHTLWAASANFGLPAFVAFVMATPGWDRRARALALAWGVGVLTLAQAASVLVANEFWQQMPVRSPGGGLFHLAGHSASRFRIFAALYNFLEIMGRGLFSLLVYFALVFLVARRPGAHAAAPNAPCPCGSGRKFKRCCGARDGRRVRPPTKRRGDEMTPPGARRSRRGRVAELETKRREPWGS